VYTYIHSLMKRVFFYGGDSERSVALFCLDGTRNFPSSCEWTDLLELRLQGLDGKSLTAAAYP